MKRFAWRAAAIVALGSALLAAGCGGGGGDPGACLSGSPEVCAEGRSDAGPPATPLANAAGHS